MNFGATILDAEGLRLSKDEARFFREADPFGFILFARNVSTADQVYALCSDMREAVGREAPILIDQEGGRVQRLRGPDWREWLPPLDFVQACGDDAPRAMYLRYRLIAHELKQLTIDVNCAPMVDVPRDETHAFLKNRCYTSDIEALSEIGRAVANGLTDGGVLPVVKHMPGHGLATLDSHEEAPIVDLEPEELVEKDFAPFKALNDLPMAMTAHIRLSAVDDAPATLSKDVIRLMREEIGFEGLIMTDDISMKALEGSVAEITRRALDAGCDIVLKCNASLSDREACANAAGQMTDAGHKRAEAAVAARKRPDEIDIDLLEAELEALSGGQVYV